MIVIAKVDRRNGTNLVVSLYNGRITGAVYADKLNGPIHIYTYIVHTHTHTISLCDSYRQIMFFDCRLIIKGTGFISLSKYTSSWLTMPYSLHTANCLHRLHCEKVMNRTEIYRYTYIQIALCCYQPLEKSLDAKRASEPTKQ